MSASTVARLTVVFMGDSFRGGMHTTRPGVLQNIMTSLRPGARVAAGGGSARTGLARR
jgi:hypothetical protein